MAKMPTLVLVDVDEVVARFLAWKLPQNFNPDNGISFEPFGNKGTPHQYKRDPSGTNLLDATQTSEMFLHVFGLK